MISLSKKQQSLRVKKDFGKFSRLKNEKYYLSEHIPL